jgi:hypothetical protein
MGDASFIARSMDSRDPKHLQAMLFLLIKKHTKGLPLENISTAIF